MQLKIVYIYHDCFAINSGGQALLFDYPENLSPEAEEALRNAVRDKNLVTLTVPMHLVGQTDLIAKLRSSLEKQGTKIFAYTKPGDTYTYTAKT